MKHLLRRRLKEIRTNITSTARSSSEKNITTLFLQHFASYNSYGAYYAVKGEVSTMEIIKSLLDLNKTVALPCTKSNTIFFYKIINLQDLADTKFAPEPKYQTELIHPDIIITPLLGYNLSGHRLGYGLGCYDKYFEANPKAVKVGLAFSNQIIPDNFAEHFDQRLDYIINEERVIKIEK